MKKILLIIIINFTFSVILSAQTDMQVILNDLNETNSNSQKNIPLQEQMKYSVNLQFIKAKYDDKEKKCNILISFTQRWVYDSEDDKFDGRHRRASIVSFHDEYMLQRIEEKLVKTDTVYDGNNFEALNTYEAVHYIDKKDAPNGAFSHKIDVISYFVRNDMDFQGIGGGFGKGCRKLDHISTVINGVVNHEKENQLNNSGQENNIPIIIDNKNIKSDSNKLPPLALVLIALFLTGAITLPQLLQLLAKSNLTDAHKQQVLDKVLPNDLETEEDSSVLDVSLYEKSMIVNDNESSTLFVGFSLTPPDAQKETSALHSVKLVPLGEAVDYLTIDDEDPKYWEAHRRYYLTFTYSLGSQSHKADDTLKFPVNLPIKVTGSIGNKNYSKTIYIKVEEPSPRLIINPKDISVQHNKVKKDAIECEVKFSRGKKWSISAEIIEGKEYFDIHVQDPISNFERKFNIKAEKLAENKNIEKGKIKIVASSGDENLEKEFIINIVKEGVYITSEEPIEVLADNKSFSYVKFSANKLKNDQLETDYDALEKIELIEVVPTDNDSKRIIEIAGLTCEFEDYEGVRESIDKNGKTAHKVFKIKTDKAVPGKEGEKYEAVIKFKCTKDNQIIETKAIFKPEPNQAGSKNWDIAYNNCVTIIEKHVHPKYQKEARDLIDKHGLTLGKEGLDKMRKDIWERSMKLWQEEAATYESKAATYDTLADIFRWVEWSADIAFDAVSFAATGGSATVAMGFLRGYIKSALVYYVEDRSFDDWLSDQFKGLIYMPGEMLLNPMATANKIGVPKAYALYTSYHIFMNIKIRNMSIWDATVQAIRQVKDVALAQWLGGKIKTWGVKTGKIPATDTTKTTNDIPDNRKSNKPANYDDLNKAHSDGKVIAQKGVMDLENAIKNKDIDSVKRQVLELQTNKKGVLELNNKNTSPEVRRIQNKVMDIYKSKSLKGTRAELAKMFDVPEKSIKFTFGTNKVKNPAFHKVGSDFDFNVEINGKPVSYRKVQEIYNRKLYNVLENDSVGKDFIKGKTPEKVSAELEHTALDPSHPEWYGEKKALSDSSSRYSDSQSMSQTISYKNDHFINEALTLRKQGNYIKSESIMAEGMRTIVKQFDNQAIPKIEVLNIKGKIDKFLIDDINIMRKVQSNEISPAMAEGRMHFNIKELAKRSGELIEAIDKFRP